MTATFDQCVQLGADHAAVAAWSDFARRRFIRQHGKDPFESFKKAVIKAAKRAKVSHLVPGSDNLYSLWEQGLSVEDVVGIHCTLESQRKRHGET